MTNKAIFVKVNKIFREVYAASTPSAVYDEIILKPDFDFNKYTINKELCDEIVDRNLKTIYPKRLRDNIMFAIYLSHLPRYA